jgi:putative holliday junction resolvase
MEIKRVLGIDPGDVRVGLALSDELGMLAHPFETIEIKKVDPVARIAAIVKEKGVTTIVVGVARNMDGTFGPAAEKCRTLIAQLREAVACPVISWDERLTTVSAQRALRDSGRKAKDQKGIIDQAAAQIILQGWLDSQPCA